MLYLYVLTSVNAMVHCCTSTQLCSITVGFQYSCTNVPKCEMFRSMIPCAGRKQSSMDYTVRVSVRTSVCRLFGYVVRLRLRVSSLTVSHRLLSHHQYSQFAIIGARRATSWLTKSRRLLLVIIIVMTKLAQPRYCSCSSCSGANYYYWHIRTYVILSFQDMYYYQLILSTGKKQVKRQVSRQIQASSEFFCPQVLSTSEPK